MREVSFILYLLIVVEFSGHLGIDDGVRWPVARRQDVDIHVEAAWNPDPHGVLQGTKRMKTKGMLVTCDGISQLTSSISLTYCCEVDTTHGVSLQKFLVNCVAMR